MKSACSFESPIGRITIAEEEGFITNVYFTKEKIPENLDFTETPLLTEAANQINSYFSGRLKKFSLPLKISKTPFIEKVLEAVSEIPYGTTATYKEIASQAGNPKACRAVGLANNKNPLPIFIPCHRVIGTNGKLTGYAGGLDVKELLLEIEKKNEACQ